MPSLRRLFTRRPRGDDPVVYAYEPHRDADADPGEVVWGWVAYEDDPSQGKDRPIVVVGRQGVDVIGVPLSTKDHRGDPDRLLVGTGGWDSQRRQSYAVLDRVLRFAPRSLRREGSALDEAVFRRLVDELRIRQEAGRG